MKSFISTSELEKGLRSILDVTSAMETTLIGKNLFMFIFNNSKTCDRIYNKQMWNFRGSLILLDRIRGDECPSDLALQSAPFWIQAYGL